MKPNVSAQQVETKVLLPFLEELLAAGKQIRMTVTGSSMYPLLRDRYDSVLLSPLKTPKKYDIVLFVRDTGEAVLHRIVKCRKEGYTFLGDNQLILEGPIARSQMVAVVTGFYRGEQYVDNNTLWYRVYRVIWCRAWCFRRWLLPLALSCGNAIKRMKRTEQ